MTWHPRHDPLSIPRSLVRDVVRCSEPWTFDPDQWAENDTDNRSTDQKKGFLTAGVQNIKKFDPDKVLRNLDKVIGNYPGLSREINSRINSIMDFPENFHNK